MAKAGKLRIAMEGARELEVDVDDVDTAVASLEAGVDNESIVWLTDSKGDRHGIVGGRLAFVIVELSSDRSIGFGR
jgi:hypothetical protein